MSEQDELKVDEKFEKWYKDVDFGDDCGRLVARWRGVLDAFSSINVETILPICQLAFGGIQPPKQKMTWFEDVFKKFDESFKIGTNESELRILAAAIIVNELEKATPQNEDVYLAIAGASFSGLRQFAVPFDIQKLLNSTLHRLSIEAATRPTSPDLSIKPFSFGADVLSQWDNNRDAALKSMAASINIRLKPLYDNAEVLCSVLDVQDDELQILWWLFGGRSQEQNVPFTKVPTDIRPLLFAKELADCVKIAPGPASIDDILAKAGVSINGKQNVLSAIGSVSEWGSTISHETTNLTPWVHPLHYALNLQAQAVDNWQGFWAASVKVKVDAVLSPLALAQQFYRERLHIRSI